ncbi:DUF4861 domain-containing protein [Namhaeicola litoreus]|uniref:DUF4861 domain-containing protein n=1 Tax=Namhaeicola litoreus TaxID=1052145 RepID=A0ABW3Y0V7_9FLAO
MSKLMKPFKLYLFFALSILIIACGKIEKPIKTITVKNPINVSRTFETIEIDGATLGLDQQINLDELAVRDNEGNYYMTQTIDLDGDKKADQILFQIDIAANESRIFELIHDASLVQKDSVSWCYSRFVPERTDDYAWENNRVAFRTFGPVAQKMIEENIKGGTLSSGIDAWLKRVDYPIINKWYANNDKEQGAYHKDSGEGLDNFHVGVSRGVGGIAKKIDSTYYFSKNFISWETISTGPIRTSFVLTYADWDAAGNTISEQKLISLDYGSNLSKFEISLNGVDTISAGLTLHEKTGQIKPNPEEGWLSHWESLDDSELGTGIVVPKKQMAGFEHYLTERKDESNLFAHIKVNNGKVIYYAGFGWKKSGQFDTKESWEKYLSDFSKRINNPLEIKMN